MANQKHLAIFKQGVKIWNCWRKEHLDIKPDLSREELCSNTVSGHDLSRINLSGANLKQANLSGIYLLNANLSGANLFMAELSESIFTKANLRGAHLHGAYLLEADLREVNLSGLDLGYTNLVGADLRETNLREAELDGAKLFEANLSGADLSRASLQYSNLHRADLSRANLSKAQVGGTLFTDIDLSSVKGLDSVMHSRPSTIGIDTIILSQGKIPEAFLRKAGVPDSIIEAIPSLVGTLKPIDFYSCFISYSSKDQDFAERLYADLQNKGVRCWFALHDMRIGDKIRPRIDESIRLYDKLLLVLSEYSVASQWVEHEVETALGKELEGKPNVLFPVRLDDKVMESKTGWASHIRLTRHVGDFTRWKNHDDYQQAFNRLLRDLKAEAETTGV